jgi:DNA topoisomerase IB
MLSTFIPGKELSVRDLKGKRLLEFVDNIVSLRKLKSKKEVDLLHAFLSS